MQQRIKMPKLIFICSFKVSKKGQNMSKATFYIQISATLRIAYFVFWETF